MQRFSVLTFSRNHIDGVSGLIEDIYDLADDIVLIDSSDKAEREKLHAMKKRKGWKKLKIYYIVPLGFMELYRPYGLKKCRNDWVLYICADERISDGLKRDMISIINNTKYSAFNMVRYENVDKGEGKSNFFTFQIMLIRKSKVRYKGIVDERPEVNGKVSMLDSSKYYAMHITELMHHQLNDYYTTSKFTKYECMSYADLNVRLLENYARMRGKDLEEVRKRRSWKLAIALLGIYERLGLKRPEREISPFDYGVYASFRWLGFSFKMKKVPNASHMISNSFEVMRMRSRLRHEEDHERAFNISRIITANGMVKFLNLENEKELSRLNKMYKDGSLAGISLLGHLLEEKYEESHRRKRVN